MLFSLIIPVFNNLEEEINQIIKSLENQIFKDFEVILIDDGSLENRAPPPDVISFAPSLNLRVYFR